MIVKKYETKNAIEFLQFAEIYPSVIVKRIISYLYQEIIYIIGLEINNEPKGFLLVKRRDTLHHVGITLFLHPQARRRGYERILLETALKNAKEQGAKHFYISYFQNHADSAALKELYTSFGFNPSGYLRHTFVINRDDLDITMEKIGLKYNRYLSSYRQKTRTFKELKAETFKNIVSNKEKIPKYFCTFKQTYCPEYSAMIWRDHDPAGWIVFEPNGKTTLFIQQLFIKENYRNKGLFIPLLVFAYQNIPKNIKRFFFYVNGNNKNMLGLLRLFDNCQIKSDVVVEMSKGI